MVDLDFCRLIANRVEMKIGDAEADAIRQLIAVAKARGPGMKVYPVADFLYGEVEAVFTDPAKAEEMAGHEVDGVELDALADWARGPAWLAMLNLQTGAVTGPDPLEDVFRHSTRPKVGHHRDPKGMEVLYFLSPLSAEHAREWIEHARRERAAP